MITCFPTFYEDELVYSLLTRYHVRSGNARFIFTADDIYTHRNTYPSVEFVNRYTDEAFQMICKDMPIEEVINEHTMYKAYVRFLKKQRRLKAYEAMSTCNSSFRNLLAIPNNGERKIKYCPLCAAADRKRYGETYWHRYQQIQRISVCVKHRCYLEDSEVRVVSNTYAGFYPAENSVPYDTPVRHCSNDIEIKLAEYMLAVLNEPIDYGTETRIGEYLQAQLPDKYMNASRTLKHMDQFIEDYRKIYEGLPVLEYEQFQKVFNSKKSDYYYICQVAMFIGITPYQLTHMPEDIPLGGIDKFYEELSIKYDIDYGRIQKIGQEVLLFQKKQTLVNKQRGARGRAWEELDNKMLQKVQEEVGRIYNAEGRPQKVSIALIERNLGLPQKQTDKLPKCKEYILSHMESQNVFWAREIIWAVKELEKEHRRVTANLIMKKINIKPGQLKAGVGGISEDNMRKKLESLCR